MIGGENGLIDQRIGSVGSAWAEMWRSSGYSLIFKNTFIMFTDKNYNRHTYFLSISIAFY